MEDKGRHTGHGRLEVVQIEGSVRFSDVCLPFYDTQVRACDRIYPGSEPCVCLSAMWTSVSLRICVSSSGT